MRSSQTRKLPISASTYLSKLRTTYATGRGTFQGSFENWSFRPTSRAAARTPFIVMLPQGPRQDAAGAAAVRAPERRSLRPIETLYLDVDLVKAVRIDDNEKTFFAEFYLSMRDSKDASIEQIEFANAFLDPAHQRPPDHHPHAARGRQEQHLSREHEDLPGVGQVHVRAAACELPVRHPALCHRYPAQAQRCAVHHPAAAASRCATPPSITDGWDPKEQYVGYDEDFVPTLDAKTPRAERRAVLQGELRVADEASDHRLLSARRGALGVHHPDRLHVDLHSRGALRGDRHDPGHGAAVGGRALSGAAQGRLRTRPRSRTASSCSTTWRSV